MSKDLDQGPKKKTFKEQEMEQQLLESYNKIKGDKIFQVVIEAQDNFEKQLNKLDSMIQAQHKANDKKIHIFFADPIAELEKMEKKLAGIKDGKIKVMVDKNGLFKSDPKKQYIRHLGVIKRTMTLIRYAISTKCLRATKRVKQGKIELKNKKERLRKILRVNLRISSYMTKLKEQFMVDVQNDKISPPKETTFLTLTGDKDRHEVSQKFYSQQYQRPQNTVFKKPKSKKQSKFKFQLPKLRLSVYNEITKDAVKMFHPNISSLTTKARKEAFDYQINSYSQRLFPKRSSHLKRLSVGGNLNKKSQLFRAKGGQNLNNLSALYKQFHRLKKRNVNLVNAITRKSADYNIRFQTFRDIFHFYYNYLQTGFNFQENEFQKIQFIKTNHAHYSKDLNKYIFDSNDPYNDVVQEFTAKHLKSYEEVSHQKTQSEILQDLIEEQKEKQREQKQLTQEMNVFEFRLKAAIRNKMFELWKEKQIEQSRILKRIQKYK